MRLLYFCKTFQVLIVEWSAQLKLVIQRALLLREKEDIEDRHERHQLVPSCCQKPQKWTACLHCRDLKTTKNIWKVGMNTIRHVQDSEDALQRCCTSSPTWSCQKHPEQRQQVLQGSHSPTPQHFSRSHHTMTWPEEAMAWRTGRNREFINDTTHLYRQWAVLSVDRLLPKWNKELVNLQKLGHSTMPLPGAEAWRTVRGGWCVSLHAASLYSRHLRVCADVTKCSQTKGKKKQKHKTKLCVN